MEPERLYCSILLLIFMLYTSQVNSANRNMDIAKKPTMQTKFLKKNSSQLLPESLKPLCFEDKVSIKLTPCDSTNKFRACFDWLTGNLKKCIDMNKGINFIPKLPVCIKTTFFQRYVVSCSKNHINFCFSFNSKYKTMEFCNSASQARTCLGTGNILQPCSERRLKRQQPQVPQLDSDAYYASCENCNIRVIMTVDENSNERPTIEIKSEPLDENEEGKPHKIR